MPVATAVPTASISTPVFEAAVRATAKAIPSSSTLPILECVKVEAEGERVLFTSTDLEVFVRREVPATVEGSFSVAIPAAPLKKLLAKVDGETMHLEVQEDNVLVLRTGKGRFEVETFSGADYPEYPTDFELSDVYKVGANDFVGAIKETLFCTSDDALRPSMQGVCVDFEEGKFVATDGHRLAMRSFEPHEAATGQYIVPAKALAHVSPKSTLWCTEGYAVMDTMGAQVVARLIDESYPNYKAVIPQDHDKVLTINRQDLLSALERVMLFASSFTNQVRWTLTPGSLVLEAEDRERRRVGREEVACEWAHKEFVIGFNGKYAVELCNHVSGEAVEFAFSRPNRASVLTLPEDSGYTGLLMPVMLNT